MFQTWLRSRLEALLGGGGLARAEDAFEGERGWLFGGQDDLLGLAGDGGGGGGEGEVGHPRRPGGPRLLRHGEGSHKVSKEK